MINWTDDERKIWRHGARPVAACITVFWGVIGGLHGMGVLSWPATITALAAVETSITGLQHNLKSVELKFAGSNIGQLTDNVKRNTTSLEKTREDVGEIKNSVHQLNVDSAVTKTEVRNIHKTLKLILKQVERD